MNFLGNRDEFVEIGTGNAAHGVPASAAYPLALQSSARIGARAVGSPASPPRLNRAGNVAEQFGGQLFERIIVSPRLAGLGNVLTQQQVTVVIWNTCRNLEQWMTAATLAGEGSATLPPLVFPVAFPPLAESIVLVTVPILGDPAIDETVTFVFPGFDGTTVIVTGQRLAVFSVEADWNDGFDETPQIWLTDILKGLTDAEQRVQLRTVPRSRLRFKVLPTGRETAFLEGLVGSWQQNLWGVPFWPDKCSISEPIAAGAAAVSFDWSEREFAPGGYVLIWRDALTYEVQTIAALVGGGATLAGLAQNSWLADGRTWIIPIRLGRLTNKIDLARRNQQTADIEVEFNIEVV